MKKCKHCQTEIDEKAKVCPTCKKKQGMPVWLIVILVIVGIALISSFGSDESTSGSNDKTGSTAKTEDITLLEGHVGKVDNEYSYEISGTLQNNTDEDFSYVQVEFYAYDAEGNLLDTCLGNNSGMEAKGTWKFTASCFFSNGDAKNVKSYKLKEITKW